MASRAVEGYGIGKKTSEKPQWKPANGLWDSTNRRRGFYENRRFDQQQYGRNDRGFHQQNFVASHGYGSTRNNGNNRMMNQRGNGGRSNARSAPNRNVRKDGNQRMNNQFSNRSRWSDTRTYISGENAEMPLKQWRNEDMYEKGDMRDDKKNVDVSMLPHTSLLTNSGVPQGINYHYFFHTLPTLLAFTRLQEMEENEQKAKNEEIAKNAVESSSPLVVSTLSEESSSVADSGYLSETPPLNCESGQTSSSNIIAKNTLSMQIILFCANVHQTDSSFGEKMRLRDFLYYYAHSLYPLCGLYVVGSSLNGFGSNKSDMDLCLMITNKDLDQKSEAIVVLEILSEALKSVEFVADQKLIIAKVPILRIQFAAPYAHVIVDVNANNSVAIKNTHLLYYYSIFDSRVRPLVLIVKEWAKQKGINNAVHATLSSYSLVLMVIHYLQCGAQPAVLPSMQCLYSKKFNHPDVRALNINDPLVPPPEKLWKTKNTNSVEELLIGFLHYYAFEFDFDDDCISVRLGKKLGRSSPELPEALTAQWRCLCIEEPFTLTNTAHSVYDRLIFDSRVKQAFVCGAQKLDASQDLSCLINQ